MFPVLFIFLFKSVRLCVCAVCVCVVEKRKKQSSQLRQRRRQQQRQRQRQHCVRRQRQVHRLSSDKLSRLRSRKSSQRWREESERASAKSLALSASALPENGTIKRLRRFENVSSIPWYPLQAGRLYLIPNILLKFLLKTKSRIGVYLKIKNQFNLNYF